MRLINRPEELPKWFDPQHYAFAPESEAEMNRATLAVLDRIPFYQSIAHKGFSFLDFPSSPAREYALTALQEWSADPYRRITEQWKNALKEALQPSVTADEIEPFLVILEEEERAKGDAYQMELIEIVKGVRHLPGRDQLLAVKDATQRMLETEEKEARQALSELTGGDDGLEPIDHAWVRKLFNYRIAAYLDLTLWAALKGYELGVTELLAKLFPDEKDPRTVADMLQKLKNFQHLRYRIRIQDGGAFDAWQRNENQQKGRR